MNIGERIKLARKKAGLTQQELADSVGDLTKQSISKYEKGKSIPTSGVLLRLSKALGVTLNFLIRPTTVRIEAVKFRKLTNVRASDMARIELDFRDRLERQLTLERILGEQLREYDGPRALQVATLQHAEKAAAELRKRWELGIEPIANFTKLLEEHGIRVVAVEPVTGFDGQGQWLADEVPVVAVAVGSDTVGDRQRFTMGHELGHLVLECRSSVSAANPRDRFEENAADRFAGALLVPRQAVLANLGQARTRLSFDELHTLKHLYGASMQCWIRRAYDCGVISEKMYVKICKHARKHGWRRKEPGDQVEAEKPAVASQLLQRGLAEGYISEARAAELAGKPLQEFRESRRQQLAY